MYRKLTLTVGMFVFLPIIALGLDPTAYVLNTIGETLSKINLNTGVISNDILTIGSANQSYPNQMKIRDTLMYVVVSGTDEIQVVNLNSEHTESFMDTPPGSNPFWMDFADEQYLFVSLLLNNSVAKMDYNSGEIVDEIAVGKSPEGVLIYQDKLYIACSGFDFNTYLYDPGEVYVFDLSGDSMLTQISVGLNPQFMALDGAGRLHVVCTGNYFSIFGSVYIIDTFDDSVLDSINIGGTPGHISIGPDNTAYLAASGFTMDGYVYSYNSLTGEVYHNAGNPIQVDLNCMTVVSFQDTTVFTGSFTDYVNVIDSSGTYLDSYAVGAGPQHIAFNYQPGDADGDFTVNLLDVTFILNWLYRGGDAPRWPGWRASADGNNLYNLLDITYLINFLYKNGPRPKKSPDWI